MGPLTVLVVEDNDKSQKLFCALLELHGHRALSAGSVAEALASVAAERPNVILMDIQLPDGDGIGALQALRNDPHSEAIPVIAVTAFAMHGDRERMLDAGFDGYITKPIDAHSFVDEITAFAATEP